MSAMVREGDGQEEQRRQGRDPQEDQRRRGEGHAPVPGDLLPERHVIPADREHADRAEVESLSG